MDSVTDEADELTRTAYDAVADVYANQLPATEPEQPIDLAMIDHFIRLLPEPRWVLDAGCGAGRMLPYLAERGCLVEGVDLSPEMIRRAHLDHPDFSTSVGNLSHLDYADGRFDGVFSWYSTIHSPDHVLQRMISETTRVLRPQGHLLVAFQVGAGMRRVGAAFAAFGHDVVMHRYHRSVDGMATELGRHGLDVMARMERSPAGSGADPQAVLIARRGDA